MMIMIPDPVHAAEHTPTVQLGGELVERHLHLEQIACPLTAGGKKMPKCHAVIL